MNCLQVGQASLMYILTQLAKMLFLATFFPMSELEEEEGGHKFDFFNDFLRVISIEEIKVALLTLHCRQLLTWPIWWEYTL